MQGRKSRRRSPDDIEQLVRANLAQGLNRFFITDDNFARNKDWEAIFDRLIQLREQEGLEFSIIIQVDTLCHKHPEFHREMRSAPASSGCSSGSRTSIPTTWPAAKKRQNKITEYRKMLLAWKNGRRADLCGLHSRASPTTRRNRSCTTSRSSSSELPIDLLEFFYLTPLPGSEDHQKLGKAALQWTPT